MADHRRNERRSRLTVVTIVIGYGGTYLAGVLAGYRSCEFSWTLESNDLINRSMQLFGAEVYKRYRIYEKTV